MDRKIGSLYNTTLEVSLRVLIILSNSDNSLNVEEIAAIDFMSVYGREFGIGDCNLHGDNYYMYGETAARHEKVQSALSELSLRGLAEVVPSKFGFRYSITVNGKELCKSFDSSFAEEFGIYVKLAAEEISTNGLHNIQNIIAEKAKQSVRRETNA